MPKFGAKRNFLRTRNGHEHARVTFVELFFDLVFVFAVTQLSHTIIEHFTPIGLIETLVLFIAVWWVWMYTSWVTNWLDPARAPVRIMLYVLMLGGLVLSTSLSKAFETRGLAFAGAYVAMQVGRSLFMLWCVRDFTPANYRNFQRIIIWFVASGILWIAGAFADGHARLAIWACAVLIDVVAPSVGFWVPVLGRSTTTDWDVEGGHMAERAGLFIIIALGESILVTGALLARTEMNPLTVAAFVVAFIGSVAMWWIYFNVGAERGSRLISEADDPGRVGRLAYVYLHLPIVAGIIVAAVGDEMLLAHPDGHLDVKAIATIAGGPALYLIGNLLFKHVMGGGFSFSHIAGLALMALLVPIATAFSVLAFGTAVSLILVIVAVWETRSIGPKYTPRH